MKKKFTLKTWLKIALMVFICWLTVYAYRNGLIKLPNQTTTGQIQMYGPYKCVYVIDGDTVIVDIDGREVKVRMIGIDTPESVASEYYEKENTEQGEIASEYTKNLLKGKQVYLEYDVEKVDKYGRTLAYIYLEDQTTMVNEILIEEGYAMIMTISPNVKHAKTFYQLQKQAQKAKKGFWDGYFE